MGTAWTAECLCPSGLDPEGLRASLADTVATVEAQMSNWRPDSDLSRVNAAPVGAWVTVPPDLCLVLAEALRIGAATGGAFCPAQGDLVAAWGFGPPARVFDIDAVRRLSACPAPPDGPPVEVDVPACRVRRLRPAALDLCGIAKGFAADRLSATLLAHGAGDHLTGIDGELVARGQRGDGTAWRVILERPQPGAPLPLAELHLMDRAVATSGRYRNRLRVGTAEVSHSMDPRRALPVQNGVLAVTVLAATCTAADALATALLVLGPQDGLAVAAAQGADVLFLTAAPEGLRQIGGGLFATPA